MKNLEIIYEDNDIILCHKPAGVATQTKRLGQQDMESLLKNYRAKKGEPPYIGIVHRLDQPVEGIMVFAKNQKAAAFLSKQIQEKIIGKYYYAVSACKPEKESGVLEHYLITDKKTNFTQVVEEIKETENSSDKRDSKKQNKDTNLETSSLNSTHKKEMIYGKTSTKAQEHLVNDKRFAKLEYRVVQTTEEKTVFDIKLHTGRQHQIRVQMAYIGCPLIGDEKYGVNLQVLENQSTDEGMLSNRNNLHGKNNLALCSYRLQFQHPTTKKQMDFSILPKGKIFQMFIK